MMTEYLTLTVHSHPDFYSKDFTIELSVKNILKLFLCKISYKYGWSINKLSFRT